MSQPEYVCKICLKDLTRDVNSNYTAMFMEPEQTLRIHHKYCALKHKAALLDMFCEEWRARLSEVTQAGVEQLWADWNKLEQLGKGE